MLCSWSTRIAALAAAILLVSTGVAAAGGCVKDTRQISLDRKNVARLSDYLCTSDHDPQTRLRVQSQRLSGLAAGVVLNGGTAPWLAALYGKYQVVNNDVLKEYKTLIGRFGSPVRSVHEGAGEGLYVRLDLGTPKQVANSEQGWDATRGAVVRSYELAPLPDIPLVDETLHLLNEPTFPPSLRMEYAERGYSGPDIKTPLDNMTVWRYLTPEDLAAYDARLARYNSLISHHDYRQPAAPKSVQLLQYLTAGGWPEAFLYTEARIAKQEPCLALDFTVNQYSFEVEIAVVENVATRPIEVTRLLGQASGGNRLRPLTREPRDVAANALPQQPVMLEPGARLVVPLRIGFAQNFWPGDLLDPDERTQSEERFRTITASPPGTVFRTEVVAELRGRSRTRDGNYVIRKQRDSFRPPTYPLELDFAFGPEWALAGVDAGGERILFATAPTNLIQITASSGVGSCPILYAWDDADATWIRHGKVIHAAQTRARAASETIAFAGLVRRFRLAEEELERATISHVRLQLQLVNGRTLSLLPHETGALDRPLALLHANDAVEIAFAPPAGIKPEEVVRSLFTVTGYYDRYSALLVAATGRR